MDKTQEKALDFMLSKSYVETIHRTITAYLLMEMSEIKRTLKFDAKILEKYVSKYPDYFQATAALLIRDHIFLTLLNNDKTKKQLELVLKDVAKKKDDIVEEIIKQYGMSKDDDVATIHFKMCKLFDSSQKKISTAIKSGDYNYIYKKWEDN